MAMKLSWDYTSLAAAYGDRPGYSGAAIDAALAVASARPGDHVCDVGAGTGHLTLPLLERGLVVDAIEPNDAMRRIGMSRVVSDHLSWHLGTGESTGRTSAKYHLVTFGSSFNVVDQPRSLAEAHRLLRPNGWLVCLWNHRDLEDPLQRRIEDLIERRVPAYSVGTRRADQRPIIRRSALFEEAVLVEARMMANVDRESWINGWRSHATLQRQAGDAFGAVVDGISALVRAERTRLDVPYFTRVCLARARVL